MAWGEMTPEQITTKLKEAGFDTTQINERLKTLDGVASKDEIKALQDSVTETKNTLAELANSLKNAAAPKPDAHTESNDGKPKGPLTIEPLAFMEDPSNAVRQIINESVAPMAIHTLKLTADIAYDSAKATLPYFAMFEDEIKKEWDKYPVQSKGNARELIENIYNLVKGRHMDEIITDTSKKTGKYNVIQSGGSTVINREEKKVDPVEALTEKEIQIAKRMGITPEDYAATKGVLKYV